MTYVKIDKALAFGMPKNVFFLKFYKDWVSLCSIISVKSQPSGWSGQNEDICPSFKKSMYYITCANSKLTVKSMLQFYDYWNVAITKKNCMESPKFLKLCNFANIWLGNLKVLHLNQKIQFQLMVRDLRKLSRSKPMWLRFSPEKEISAT